MSMSGLLEKDFCILKQRKQFFLLLFGITVVMGFTVEQSFIVAYLTMICAIFSLSTLNYDEFDNCYAFLLTLPVTEKLYVIEKFVFTVILGIIGWVVSACVVVVVSLLQNTPFQLNGFLEYLIYIPVGVIFVAINLPVQIKYGQEKSRMVMMALMGGCVLIGILIKNMAERSQIDTNAITQKLDSMPYAIWMLGCVGLSLFVTYISALISIKIMKKKEY